MLLSLRCGEVLDAQVSDVRLQEGHKAESLHPQVQAKMLLNSHDNKLVPNRRLVGKEKLVIEIAGTSLLSSHSSLQAQPQLKQTHVAAFPFHPLIVSAGDDQVLRLWHCRQNKLLTAKYIGSRATTLSLSPDGNFLAVGLASGVMMLLDSRVTRKKGEQVEGSSFVSDCHCVGGVSKSNRDLRLARRLGEERVHLAPTRPEALRHVLNFEGLTQVLRIQEQHGSQVGAHCYLE